MAISGKEHQELLKMHAKKRGHDDGYAEYAAQKSEVKLSRKDFYFVYFIQAISGGPIKIGKAFDVKSRFTDHQVSNHEELCVLSTISGCRKDLERIILKHFSHINIRGEWFLPEDELMEFIGLSINKNNEKIYKILGCAEYSDKQEVKMTKEQWINLSKMSEKYEDILWDKEEETVVRRGI